MGITDKISNAIGDFFNNDAKAAANTVDFAKTFTKGVTINGLTEAQTAAMAANTAETESHFRIGIRNKQGYSGLYQFGGEALAEVGYMKKTGGGWRQQNEAMKNPSNWLNGLSLQKFLSSRELQDKAYVALVNKNLQYGRGMGGDKFQQLMKDYHQVAKYAKMAHLKGAGNAVKGLLYGRDAADGNGTSMIAYGNKAAANVDAILKAMGDGKPVSNAKSDNPVFRLGQQAGEGVRNAVSKVYNKVTGNTTAAPSAPATKLPNKPGVAPAAIAKPTQHPASNTGGLLGLTGIGSIKSNLVDDAPVVEHSDKVEDSDSNLSSLFSNLNATNTGYVDNKGAFSVVPSANTVKAKPVAKDKTTLLAKVTKGTPISPVVNTGDFNVAKSGGGVSSRGYKAASYARSHARGKSIGRCANYVATALLSSGYRFTRQPSAYMYHTNNILTNAGFTQIDPNAQWIPGDVIVINRFSGHPHGHICIWDGRNWISDFIQRRYTPYSNGTPGGWTLYRDTQAMNGAKPASGWCQGTPGGGASVNTLDSDVAIGGSDTSVSSDTNTGDGKPQRKYKTNTDLNAAVFTNYEKATGMNGQSSNVSSKNTASKTAPVKTPTDVKSKFLSSSFNADSNIGGGISSNFLSNDAPVNYLDINEVKRKLTPDAPVEEQVDMPDEATSITSNFTDTKGKQAIVSNIDRAKQTEQIAVQAQIKHQQNLQELAGDSLDVIKEQLRVQQNMAKDISKLVALMSEANKLAVSNSSNQSTKPTNTPEPKNQQGFMNKHSKTINTVEPVSMKIQ